VGEHSTCPRSRGGHDVSVQHIAREIHPPSNPINLPCSISLCTYLSILILSFPLSFPLFSLHARTTSQLTNFALFPRADSTRLDALFILCCSWIFLHFV
jgi:hypothetical protein